MEGNEMKVATNDLQSPQRLGFHEIVPGHQTGNTEEQGADGVPEFDLDHQMMARHRRETAQRRRGPGQRVTQEPQPIHQSTEPMTEKQASHWWLNIKQTSSRVIGDIVAQDIASLCRGERVFG